MAYSLKKPMPHNHVSNPHYWETYTTANTLIDWDFATVEDAEKWAVINGATACSVVFVAPQPYMD